MKLVKNLYAYLWQGRDNNCNTYLFANILDEGKHAIIDPGHVTTPSYREPSLERLFNEMKKDGISPGTIGLIILTHSHPDHCEAAETIKERYQARVALHKAEEGWYRMLGGIDFYLEEGELELGKEKFKIYHTPGHSPGSISIYWPDEKVLIVGDVIFYQSTGRVDLPGGSAFALKKSIEKLAELDVEYLLTGHQYGVPGIVEGREKVKANFDYVKRNIFPYL